MRWLKQPASPSPDPLTPDELKALEHIAELKRLARRIVSNGCRRVEDSAELTMLIHDLEARILAQAASRAYPDRFQLLGGLPR